MPFPPKWFRDIVLKPWYSLINRADVEGVLHFMNYGFHGETEPVDLAEEDESERYPVQLYHHVGSQADLEGKDVLEVGCGRGGGLSYVARYLKPRSALGVDLNRFAIDFCRRTYPNVAFDVMDAQDLNLPDRQFDVVVNVESSHRYPNFERFAREVHRVLRPGGLFLFADFRYSRAVDGMKSLLERIGFRTVYWEVINDQVLAALRLDADRRMRLIQTYLPRLLRSAAREFAGTPGTKFYRSLENSDRTYVCFALSR